MNRILIVEDDDTILLGLKDDLEFDEWAVVPSEKSILNENIEKHKRLEGLENLRENLKRKGNLLIIIMKKIKPG